MKFTVSTAEFKTILKLVETLGNNASSSMTVDNHSIALFKVDNKTKELKVEFAASGAFLNYTFKDAECIVAGKKTDGETLKSIDLSGLFELNFPGSKTTINIEESSGANTLSVESGKMKGDIKAPTTDVEGLINDTKKKLNEIEAEYPFVISAWLKALSGHFYGAHYAAQPMDKRPVRAKYDNGKIYFMSQNTVSAGYTVIDATLPIKKDFDFYFSPKPLKLVLADLPRDVEDVFYFGLTKSYWKIQQGRIEVWFPNETQAHDVDLTKIVGTIRGFQSFFEIKMPLATFRDALKQAAPFINSSVLTSKEDMPIVSLTVNAKTKKSAIKIDTAKADAEIDLEGDFVGNKIELTANEDVSVNFKFISEFCNALITCANKEGFEEVESVEEELAREEAEAKAKKKGKKKDKEEKEPEIISGGDEQMTIRWWPYNDAHYPMKGKVISLEQGENLFLTARVKKTMNATTTETV